MSLFSQRHGHKPVRDQIQIDSIDGPLRNGLWTVYLQAFWTEWGKNSYKQQVATTDQIALAKTIWINFFKEPMDTMPQVVPDYSNKHFFIGTLRNYFFNFKWFELYDFIEFNCISCSMSLQTYFTAKCNAVLETEMSAYRFLNNQITPISNQIEIDTIEDAFTSPFHLANTHLISSLKFLSDRNSPDYRNSIKESISAVENVCSIIADKPGATLGEALNMLRNSLHPALKKAFDSLYGYTSDANGIRHALLEESNLTFADAKFMLVTCSAFINYLKEMPLKK